MQSCRLLSIIVTGLLFLMSLSGYCFGEELSVTMLNVGQADAFLVQTAGKRVLIDAGDSRLRAHPGARLSLVTLVSIIQGTGQPAEG